jgi:hypothetical protein
MPSSVVFLGPSLPVEEAAAILDARYLPPIRRGDLDALLRKDRPDAVGIVDGEFFQSFSISPKEVLRAMDAGVRVFGSSSMGALRAAELAPYGMIGAGRVAALFTSGELDADDEVAMVFDGATLAPASEPMVNIRIALDTAAERGVISATTKRRLVDEAKQLYYPERSFRRVFARVGAEIPAKERAVLELFLKTEAPDAKGDDARELLRRMSAYLAELKSG